MARLVEYMDRKFYPHMNTNWDDAIFRQYILEKACPEFVCLDYGAGRGNVKLMNFRHVVKKVCGVDVDSAVFSNPHLDEARLIDSPDNKIAYGD
ncbi:hypothetical protein GWN42_33655, partial [candidate division KSB1 bacterium]|nr:hypothetical protein [Phycisphaerae bacterium]NIP55529.1 hypothetical protein [Phycisphaerae bacterium]NIV97607.1 hypothetical protein [candidate division KSB1 bacterium]NIX31753.1 hypothetical protein [Phycisphaerae bacterium]